VGKCDLHLQVAKRFPCKFRFLQIPFSCKFHFLAISFPCKFSFIFSGKFHFLQSEATPSNTNLLSFHRCIALLFVVSAILYSVLSLELTRPSSIRTYFRHSSIIFFCRFFSKPSVLSRPLVSLATRTSASLCVLKNFIYDGGKRKQRSGKEGREGKWFFFF